jgi:hypothetical protein
MNPQLTLKQMRSHGSTTCAFNPSLYVHADAAIRCESEQGDPVSVGNIEREPCGVPFHPARALRRLLKV